MGTGLIICNGYPKILINGAIIDAFEYYIAILEYNPDFKLFMPGFTKPYLEFLKSIFQERYYLDDLKWEDNIVLLSSKGTMRYKFDKVLILDYGSISRLKGILVSKEIIILSDLYTDTEEFMFRKDLYNTTFYGEMPFVYKDYQYTMKMLFDRYKPLNKIQRGYYITAPTELNGPGLSEIEKERIKNEVCFREGAPIYFKKEEHMSNLFEYFDIYIYYHLNRYFDPRSRLPVESLFYGKQIKYINKHNVKDGSYYRFCDLKENGISNRILNKDDEVVRLFI